MDYRIESRSWPVREIPQRLRPREEMARVGAEHVSDDVLLAILLRSGVQGVNVIELARGLLQDYGSLAALAKAPVAELAARRGMGEVKAQVLKAALEIARRLGEEAQPDRPCIRTPADVVSVLGGATRGLDTEVFWVLLLDAKNRLKGRPVEVTRGLLDASLVHPREVFRQAIQASTAAVVVAHNHPSGDPAPSAEDIRITKQLVEAGRIVDIRVLDHVILGRAEAGGGTGHISMREAGLLKF